MKRCVIDVDACLVRAPDARYKRHGVSRSYRLADFDVLSLAAVSYTHLTLPTTPYV